MLAEQQFRQLLERHIGSLGDRRQFAGLLRDLMPGMALQSNLILNLYDLGIHREIEKAPQLDSSFSYRFTKMLCDDYGVSRRNADWAVAVWCVCYGKELLGKRIVAPPSRPAAASAPASAAPTGAPSAPHGIDTTFDIATSDYCADWRNIYDYEIDNGGVIIRKYIDFDAEEVTVPETIEGYPVVEIGDEAFLNCRAMKRIFLPEGLRIVRRKAFENCTFESIDLPESLIEFQYYAFGACHIRHISVPQRVVRINRYVFAHCGQLADVRLPSGLISVEGHAFSHCAALTQIDIPYNVKEIGEYAFEHCVNLSKIRIPRSVLNMGRHDYESEHIFGVETCRALTVYCHGGSEALQYARRHGIAVDRFENF